MTDGALARAYNRQYNAIALGGEPQLCSHNADLWQIYLTAAPGDDVPSRPPLGRDEPRRNCKRILT